MNIGIVTRHSYPKDQEIRVKKIASTLHSEGYNVLVICPKEKKQKLKEGEGQNAIHEFGYFSKLPWLNRFLSSPLPMNPFWAAWIARIVRQEVLTLLIVRDLRLALPTIVVAKTLKLPIVLDLGENFPALAQTAGKHKISDYIIRSKILISLLEYICAKLADHIWVVVEENRQRLIDKRIDGRKITIVSNVPIINKVESERNYNLSFEKPRDQCRIIFVGLLDIFRDLALFLRSIPHILKKANIELVIVGDGPERTMLEDLARNLQIENVVRFTGWTRAEAISGLIKESDIGIIPHKINDLTQTTIPNKLFDYMLAGLPVLSTNIKPIMRLLEENKCGLIIPDDPKETACIALKLIESPELRRTMGQNGREAVFQKYNWEMESKNILRTIKTLSYPKEKQIEE